MSPNPQRIVIDTNVLISAALKPHSLPKAAVKAAVLNHRLLISDRTYAELENKLLQTKFDAYVSWEERIQFLELYLLTAEKIPVTTVINACRDPNDNLFLELAVDGHAHVLITGDTDLLALHPFQEVAILTPEAALKYLTSAK